MKLPIPTDLDISPEDMDAGLVTLSVEFSINAEDNTMTPISVDGVELDMEEEAAPAEDQEEDESTESYVASQMAKM